MKKILIPLLLIFSVSIYSQTFSIENYSGTVKVQSSKDGKFFTPKRGQKIEANSFVTTGKNSSVQIKAGSSIFTLKSFSSININSLRKMNSDEFILSLAKGNLIPFEKTKSAIKYNQEKTDRKKPFIESDNAGIQFLNGAVQLAAEGYTRQAVVAAREAYRNYPETKNITPYRLYFTDILLNNKLLDEAKTEYTEISKLSLSEKEKREVEEKLNSISKKIHSK